MTGMAALIITTAGVIGLPLLGFMLRMTVVWTRTQDKLTDIAGDMDQLVRDKDRVHRELVEQMREDRKATNERLTWLERNAWPQRGR